MAISLVVAKKCLELTMKEYPKGYAAYKPGHPRDGEGPSPPQAR
jgi:hypothetical protein